MPQIKAGDMVVQVKSGCGTNPQDTGRVARVLEVKQGAYPYGETEDIGIRIADREFYYKQEWRGIEGFALLEDYNKRICDEQ